MSEAKHWDQPQVVQYFDRDRSTYDHLYPSERFFLDQVLKPGISILDVGCAQGGFYSALADRLGESFAYHGIDISPEMIKKARSRFPKALFESVAPGTFGSAQEKKYDLVLCLGILHLHLSWRETLSLSWNSAREYLLFDLRESARPTLEDPQISSFAMGASGLNLPYIVLNTSDALREVEERCYGAKSLNQYGYLGAPSRYAKTPESKVLMKTYLATRSA